LGSVEGHGFSRWDQAAEASVAGLLRFARKTQERIGERKLFFDHPKGEKL
jgi:hypothetical protein